MSSAACTTTSPWLRRTPTGLRASKASRSVLHGASPVLSTIDEARGSSRRGFDEQRISTPDLSVPTDDVWPLTPTTPPQNQGHPFADGEHSSSDDDSEEEVGQVVVVDERPPMSPLSYRTTSTDDTVQIVRARAQRISTARARSHSINEIRQLLSPPPDSTLLPPWSPLKVRNAGTSPSPRSLSPPPPPPPRSAARRPRAIAKDMGALLEHINEDESNRLNSAVRTNRSFSLPGIAPQHSSNPVSLPPPPRPRNRALVRTAQNSHSTQLQSPPAVVFQPPPRRSSLEAQEQPPTPPPKDTKPTLAIQRESIEHHRLSLYSIPLSPVGIPLPPSTATANFPQSPHSTVFHTASPPTTPQYATFLPSCRATSVHSSTIIDWPSPRPSEDRPDRSSNRLSTLSNPFGDFTFLRPFANNRASGISFGSNASGSSARSPTEAESIPIGLHCATSQDAESLLPCTPRSSWLRSGFEVDVLLPQADQDEEEDDESAEESSRKSTEKTSLTGRERAKTLTLPCIQIASLNKAARVLGISGDIHHVPHLSSPSSMSSSPENATPTTQSDPSQLSFLPSTAPPSAFSMGNIGRRLSKRSSPSSERRRSEDVPRPSSQTPGRLMAHVDRFIGRTPSPAGRTRELDSEDEASSPSAIHSFPKPTVHGRKHSSSDPSIGLSGRPSTSNMRTPAQRAELVKKARKIQQVLGHVPPVAGSAGNAFYGVTRAARSEDSLVTPVSARGDVLVVAPGPVETRHRSTASLSSRPLLALSPALQADGSLNIRTSGSGDDFGLGVIDGGVSPVSPMPARPDGEDVEVDGQDEEADEAAAARRAKRAKVAKLNRYLGSRVPANLVLGLEDWDYEQGLPEARSEDEESIIVSVFSGRKKRRASDGDYTLIEDGMNDMSVMSSEEKARAVRRKAKMEKVFGERPPQRLYQLQTGTDTPSRSEADDGSGPENDQAAEPLDGSEGGEHYQSYRASFNSLAYFVSNADRDSLEGLYNIVSGPSGDSEAQRNQFAARRKRAAKLSNFFGVSYRDLFGAVLDILESDVKEDKEEGSLSAAETQDLLRKLKSLKDKKESIRV